MGWDSLLANEVIYLRDSGDFGLQKITEALGEPHEAFNEFIMKWSSDDSEGISIYFKWSTAVPY